MVFTLIRTLLISSLFLFLSGSAFAETDIDLNRDGFSDIVFVNINSDASLAWNRVSTGASASAASSLGLWGVNGNMLAPGAWFSSNSNHLGVVALSGSKIMWYVRDGNGVLQKVRHGTKGMTVLSGGDYNDNGILDAVVASSDGTVSIKTEAFAKFLGKNASEFEIKFGSRIAKRGKLFFLSHEGQGDHVAYLVRKNNKYTLYTRDVFNNQTKIRLRGSGADKLTDVFPVESPNGSDYIGIVTKKPKKLYVTVRTKKGSIVDRRSFKTGSVVTTGNYLEDPGHEIAVRVKKGMKVFNPVTKRAVLFTVPAGIPADHVNRSKLGVSSGGNSGSGGSGGSGGGSGGSGGGGDPGKACGNIQGFSTGVLWKPDSDVNDARGGKPVVLFQGGKKPGGNSVNIYATDGTKICNFTFKPPTQSGINGNSDHYYSGWHGGCAKTGGQIAAAAKKASGSEKVYLEGRGSICYGPVHPNSRSGGIG